MVEGFARFLRMFEMKAIIDAIEKHVMSCAELPTPSDIANIIDPSPPKPDWAAYVGIRQKVRDGIFIIDAQRDYLRWCEEQVTRGLKDYEERQAAKAIIADLETKMTPPNPMEN